MQLVHKGQQLFPALEIALHFFYAHAVLIGNTLIATLNIFIRQFDFFNFGDLLEEKVALDPFFCNFSVPLSQFLQVYASRLKAESTALEVFFGLFEHFLDFVVDQTLGHLKGSELNEL